MEQVIIQIILVALEQALASAVEGAINYIIRKVVDEAGRCVTEIVYQIDSDGDGTSDTEQVVYTLDTLIPSFSDGYCLCNDGDDIGVGLPQFDIIDGTTIADIISDVPTITGNSDGYLIDYDHDGEFDDVIIPLPDFTGDGLGDWGLIIDDDDNGVPDASPDAPFYPVGSDGYDQIANGADGVDIVLVSSDGEIAVYDRNGNIKADDVDNAYALWVSENGIMNKPIKNYTVTEGLLFLSFVVGAFAFVAKAFRKRRVNKNV